MTFPDFNSSASTITSKTLPAKQQTIKAHNFNGFVIEVLEKKPESSKAPVALQESTKFEQPPKNLPKSVIEFDMKISKTNQPLDLPKPVTMQRELNVIQLPGSLKTMEFQTRKKPLPSAQPSQKLQPTQESFTPVKGFQTVAASSKPPVAGAVGMWATKDEAVECVKKQEPEVEPPPVTEEDWEIFKKFLFPEPEPQTQKFVCPICTLTIFKNEGVVLKGCLHNFCRLCLVDEIKTITIEWVKSNVH